MPVRILESALSNKAESVRRRYLGIDTFSIEIGLRVYDPAVSSVAHPGTPTTHQPGFMFLRPITKSLNTDQKLMRIKKLGRVLNRPNSRFVYSVFRYSSTARLSSAVK